MAEAEKQSNQGHSESQLSDMREIHPSQSRPSVFIGADGYDAASARSVDCEPGEMHPTASQKGKGRAVGPLYDNRSVSLHSTECDVESRSDDENIHPGMASSRRRQRESDGSYYMGQGVAI